MSALLVNHLWQTTLFCCAVWLITRMMRANQAALRHWLWLLASVKFLVPFSGLVYLGTLAQLPMPEATPESVRVTLEMVSPVLSPVAPTSTLENAAPATLTALLVATWLLGAMVCALRWWMAWRSSVDISNAARPAPDIAPGARVTETQVVPSVVGVLNPVVLLPAALLKTLDRRQLEAVLAHEHQHIARQDNLKAHIHELVQVLFWFHPMVWRIGRRLLQERERACDEAVLEHGHDPAVYAGGILEACRTCGTHHAGVMSALSGDLTTRVAQILRGPPPRTAGTLTALCLLLCAPTVALLPMITGAVSDAAHRRELLDLNSSSLRTAEFLLLPAASGNVPERDLRQSLTADEYRIFISNSSLRDLVALAYGVETWEVSGAENDAELDSQRYDIQIVSPQGVVEPGRLNPLALRAPVTKLLALRFDLEIHVNHHCQAPCGRRAFDSLLTTR